MDDAIESLQAMFPDADKASLGAVLMMTSNDVVAATSFLLGDAAEAGVVERGRQLVDRAHDGGAR